MRKTKEHSAFFALIENNIVKPNVIKDMGFINGCWQEIASTRRAPIVTSITTRTPFGVSVAEAFKQVETQP